jgi:hypothetical protein
VRLAQHQREVVILEGDLAVAKARLAQHALALEGTTLRAASARRLGAVAALLPGTVVQAGAWLGVLGPPGAFLITAAVPPRRGGQAPARRPARLAPCPERVREARGDPARDRRTGGRSRPGWECPCRPPAVPRDTRTMAAPAARGRDRRGRRGPAGPDHSGHTHPRPGPVGPPTDAPCARAAC